MFNKFRNHPHIGYFLVYSLNYLLYGAIFVGLGPMIPFLSEQSGLIETEYSFLFSCRSLGMLFGAILLKFLKHSSLQLNCHQKLSFSSAAVLIASIMFSVSHTTYQQGLWMTLAAMGYSIMEIQINNGIIIVNPPEDIQFWMLITHGAYGIGGLIGPLFVYAFQIHTYTVLGLIMAPLILAYIKLQSPEETNFMIQQGIHQENSRSVPPFAQFLLCFALFLYVGMESTYGGWISSYSILAGVSDKETATIFPTIFWMAITAFRFGLAFAPGTTSKKMRILIQGNIVSGVVSILLIKADLTLFSCYFSSVALGLAMSSLFPLVISLSTEFGFALDESQMGNLVTCGVVAEGIITMCVGMLMDMISIDILFYSLIMMSVCMWMARYKCVQIFNRVLDEQKSSMHVELLDKQSKQ